ncbi:MAG TPA: hypothetical protein VGK39_03835 [Cyclobacteriaceae bacterium]
MRLFLNTVTSLLLLLNGVGALYGGWNLITHPDGSSIQLSMQWLEHTPFEDYLIPGIVLLGANGIFSFVVLVSVLFKWRNYAQLISVQGLILTGWIMIQMLLMQTVHFLHIALGCMGIALMSMGLLLKPGRQQTHKN